MGDRNRDGSVDRLLRQSMSSSLTSPTTSACLDGETIAAWAEHTLRGAEADHVERHLSECARCSALLATFVRATPEAGARESLWHRYHLRLLVPLATAATAVMIWFAIPDDQRLPEPYQSASQRQSNDAPVALPSVRPFSPAVGTSEPVEELPKKQVGLGDPRARPQESKELLERRADAFSRDTSPEIARQEAAPSLADATPPQAGAGRAEADRAIETQKPAMVTAETPASPSSASVARETARLRALNARQFDAAVEITSPNSSNRWRITTGRLVEYSTSDGSRWQAASLPPSEPLTAGFSPASSVCWLVGRAGTILVTTDGLRFVRVPFPEAVDLISVRAIDHRTATVTTADRRTYRTTDGGTTWNRP